MKATPYRLFVVLALVALWLGMLFGVVAAWQFLNPSGESPIPFQQMRPLHVTFVLSWIFLAAAGGIYAYLHGIARRSQRPIYARLHFVLFAGTGILITVLYLLSRFSGREYMEFPGWVAAPIAAGWVLFAINFFRSAPLSGNMPVYLWQWLTGSIFIIVTLAEAQLWHIPFFRDNIVRDITVQWKSYGAIIGSWNMLVYGTAMYLMCRIGGSDRIARTPMAYFLYFLGFTNLLFNWGHHTYIVPSAPWIRHISYIVSMSELIILGVIVWNWKTTLTNARKHRHSLSYRFLIAGEIWIFLNLLLALIMSVPALNVYTHGTHVTVAHAMGSTIGINSMILIASLTFLLHEERAHSPAASRRALSAGLVLGNVSLAVFWISLIVAGITKGVLTYASPTLPYREILNSITPALTVSALAGIALFAGMTLVVVPLLSMAFSSAFNRVDAPVLRTSFSPGDSVSE